MPRKIPNAPLPPPFRQVDHRDPTIDPAEARAIFPRVYANGKSYEARASPTRRADATPPHPPTLSVVRHTARARPRVAWSADAGRPNGLCVPDLRTRCPTDSTRCSSRRRRRSRPSCSRRCASFLRACPPSRLHSICVCVHSTPVYAQYPGAKCVGGGGADGGGAGEWLRCLDVVAPLQEEVRAPLIDFFFWCEGAG